MDVVQVFNWFCKEQKIVHLIRKMFYTISPKIAKYQDGGIVYEPLTYTQYVENGANQYGIGGILRQFVNAYFYKVGWDKYDKFCKEYKMANISNKWHYFVSHNLNVKNMKVGDTIEYERPRWDDLGEHIREKTRGKIVGINLDNSLITLLDEKTNTYRSIYGNQFKANNINLELYIKRKRKEYHGVNR